MTYRLGAPVRSVDRCPKVDCRRLLVNGALCDCTEVASMSTLQALAAFLRARYKFDASEACTEYERTYADAHRALLADLIAERHDVVDDCWYTCPAATEERDGGETCDDTRAGGPCDCGRDARLEQRLRILAAPYRECDGYRDEWRTLSPEERAQRRW